jgi:hypothetical protein
MTDGTRESRISRYLGWLGKRAVEHGEIEATTRLDAYGDCLVTCPLCKQDIWIKPTAEERRKWVFRIPHACAMRKDMVHFTIRREDRTVEEILGLLNERDPDEQYEVVPVRSRTVRNPKR